MSPPRALVTGITGQDGSYLAEQLLAEGFEVTALVRRAPSEGLGCAEHLRSSLIVVHGDMTAGAVLRDAVARSAPDEVYHLAGPTSVEDSWTQAAAVLEAFGVATARLLAAVTELSPGASVFVAASSEVFGDAGESPQNEDSRCRPLTPYGVAKLAGLRLVGAWRRRHGLRACSGITYNHESPRRPEHFVTRKVTAAAAAISVGRRQELVLGDLEAVRDWSHAEDVMTAARLMVRAPTPADYVIASGRGRTVRELVEVAFACAGVDPAGHVRVDPALVRPAGPVAPVGDPSRIRSELGWRPAWDFERLVAAMVDADLKRLRAVG